MTNKDRSFDMLKEIIRKELAVYFLSPFAYLMAGFFLLTSGIVFSIYNIVGAKSDFYGMFGALNYFCIFLFPVLTMRIWADEKKNYTDRLLLTSPVRMSIVLTGKYIAAFIVFAASLASTAYFIPVVLAYSDASFGTAIASYLAFLFLGAAYISICFFAAILAGKQITAVLASFVMLVGFMLIGYLAGVFPSPLVSGVLNALALVNKFDTISSGVLSVGSLYYYLSIVGFFLYWSIMTAETGLGGGTVRGPGGRMAAKARIERVARFLAVLGVVVVTNLLAAEIPWSYDMTVDKLYTLTGYSTAVLSELEEPVEIAVLSDEEENTDLVTILLNEYVKARPDLISVKFIDADRNPMAARYFDVEGQGLANGNVLFKCGGRVERVHDFELVRENEFAPGRSFDGERLFTGAILKVTSPFIPTVVFTRGHEEDGLDSQLSRLKGRLESEARRTRGVMLLSEGLDPGDVTVMASPKRDIDPGEAAVLEEFLNRGGRLMVLLDLIGPEIELTNLREFLRRHGVAAESNFIVEESTGRTFANNKMVVVPSYSNSGVVDTVRTHDLSLVLPYPGNLEQVEDVSGRITAEPLLFSSEKSWIRYDWNNSAESMQDGDVPGPATIAYALDIDNSDRKEPAAKMVVVYNGGFITDEMVNVQANFDFFINALNWLEDKPATLSIRPKVIDANRLVLPGIVYITVILASSFLVPAAVFAAGVYVWSRRRKM